MNLKNLTYLELIDLRSRIEGEIKDLKNREKVKIYSISIPYIDTKSFLDESNAMDYLRAEIVNENFKFSEDGLCYIEIEFVDKSNTKYCEDYIDKN